MPRPRTVPDHAILDAALAIVEKEGPDALTFASAGKAAGLAPATLVQRFSTRAGLLQATLLRAWDRLDAATTQADIAADLSVDGAISLLVSLSESGENNYGEGLLVLREDMRDPILRARGSAWGRALAFALGRRLTDDSRRQELLGRLMASQWQGAQLWWAFSRDGDFVVHIEAELRAWCLIALSDEM